MKNYISKSKGSLQSSKNSSNNNNFKYEEKDIKLSKKNVKKLKSNDIIYFNEDEPNENNNIFQFLDNNKIFDINEDLLNKQKQLKEIEKQIKKSTKKSKTNNIYTIQKNNNKNEIKNINIEISNNFNNNLDNKDKNEELNNLIRETKEEILLNHVNLGINNTKEKNIFNNYLNNFKIKTSQSNNINNFNRYEIDGLEEDKNNDFPNYHVYETNNKKLDINYNYLENMQLKSQNNSNQKESKISTNIKEQNKNNFNNETINDNLEVDNLNNKNKFTTIIEEMEQTYLTKLSNLQKENNNYIEENRKLKEEIEKINNELNEAKNEINIKKESCDKINYEYELLNKKYENLVNNQNKISFEKEKQMQDEIEELKSIIDNLNIEIKAKEEKSKSEVNQLKQMLDNLKIIHEQLKDQYDLLILKMNTVNQENFSLKRELYFYQNNINNNLNINNNYNMNNNISNFNSRIDLKGTSEKISNEKKSQDINAKEKEENKDINNSNKKIKTINNELLDTPNDKTNNKLNNNGVVQNNSKKDEKKNEIIPTITKSHRKFIANINQNDSSGVSSLLKNYVDTNDGKEDNKNNDNENMKITSLTKENNLKDNFSNIKNNNENINMYPKEGINNTIYTNYKNFYNNKKTRIEKTKSADKIKYFNIPLESNYDKKIKEIKNNLMNLQKQRNTYLNEYNRLPEQPKTKNDLNYKRKIKKIIDEIGTNINIYTNKENNFINNY